MTKECEAVKFCKCCGCSDEDGWLFYTRGLTPRVVLKDDKECK